MNRGGGKLYRRDCLTTRSLREAWPEGAYDGAKQPSGSGGNELFDGKHGEKTQKPFLGGFELRENVRLASVGRPDRQDIDNVGGR